MRCDAAYVMDSIYVIYGTYVMDLMYVLYVLYLMYFMCVKKAM